MRGARDSRSRGVICLESRAPSRVRGRSGSSSGRITAPTATGPASAPRPASSSPAMCLKYGQRFNSYARSGFWIIQSAACIPPDEEQVEEHAQRVADDADLAVGVVIPLDGNFPDRIAAMARNVKQLHVEGPSGEGLIRENIPRHLRTDAFESALGILQSRQD